MKYLDSKPFNIAVNCGFKTRPQVVENGGPATRIPEDAKCPSGRHNTRLTECYCRASLAAAKPEVVTDTVHVCWSLIDGRLYVEAPDGSLVQYIYHPPDSPIFTGLDRE